MLQNSLSRRGTEASARFAACNSDVTDAWPCRQEASAQVTVHLTQQGCRQNLEQGVCLGLQRATVRPRRF